MLYPDEDLTNKLSEIGNRNFALQDNGELCEWYKDAFDKIGIIHYKSNGKKYTYDNLQATKTAGASKELWTGKWSMNGASPRTVAILRTRGGLENDKEREKANARIKKENQFYFLNSSIQAKTIDGFGLNLFDKDTYFQVSELSEKGSLATYIENNKCGPSEIKKAMLNILSTLSGLHEKGFIHGDIKPDNILVYDTGYALIDYDMVKDINNKKGKWGTEGTIEFFAPEYIVGWYADKMNEVTTHKIDIWALGATIFEMIDPKHRPLYEFLGVESQGKNEKPGRFLCEYGKAAHQAHQKIIEEKVDNNTNAAEKELWAIVALMLDANPKTRPTAQELYYAVSQVETN